MLLELEKAKKDKKNSLRDLRIADLELFITAAQTKSLGKSATFHHLSQGAASAAIQRVEMAFGLSLCTHERRQFRLTRDGLALLGKVENWINQLKEIGSAFGQNSIRMITTHAIAQIALPALLSIENVEFIHKRPDEAYASILNDEADLALVLDNAPWKGVATIEVGRGNFQLYSREKGVPLQPVLLPEDQMEVLHLQQSWKQIYGTPIEIKARIPSWSLIASICAESNKVGFLPDFLGKKFQLHPVLWQPTPCPYRVLALYKKSGVEWSRYEKILNNLRECFLYYL